MRLREKDPADVHGKAQIRDSCYTSLLILSHSLLLLSHSLLLTKNYLKNQPNKQTSKPTTPPKKLERMILTECSAPQPKLCWWGDEEEGCIHLLSLGACFLCTMGQKPWNAKDEKQTRGYKSYSCHQTAQVKCMNPERKREKKSGQN